MQPCLSLRQAGAPPSCPWCNHGMEFCNSIKWNRWKLTDTKCQHGWPLLQCWAHTERETDKKKKNSRVAWQGRKFWNMQYHVWYCSRTWACIRLYKYNDIQQKFKYMFQGNSYFCRKSMKVVEKGYTNWSCVLCLTLRNWICVWPLNNSVWFIYQFIWLR